MEPKDHPNTARIRRYGNRKLYDVSARAYIQYQAIFDLIRKGAKFRVVNHIGKDITHWTIAQALAKHADDQEVKDVLDQAAAKLRQGKAAQAKAAREKAAQTAEAT